VNRCSEIVTVTDSARLARFQVISFRRISQVRIYKEFYNNKLVGTSLRMQYIHTLFSIDLILTAHCGPIVDLAFNRNEYQESYWG
jgi:hypothetical protein